MLVNQNLFSKLRFVISKSHSFVDIVVQSQLTKQLFHVELKMIELNIIDKEKCIKYKVTPAISMYSDLTYINNSNKITITLI